MRVKWRGLELPSRVIRDDRVSNDQYGRFTAEPFERGFGTTVGNSLRRILLSSLEGAAVVNVRIKGATHEFSSLTGVMEDVTDIILNIKSIVVKLEDDETREMTLRVNKAGTVTAGMIEAHPSITVVNKDQVIATVTEDDAELDITFTVQKGRGYRTAVENMPKGEELEAGLIYVDSTFSPVTRVRYATEDARVGQKTDYDRLILEVWTNGTVSPENAVVEAAKILRKHLNPFVQYFEMGSDLANDEAVSTLREAARPTIDPEIEQKLNMTVQELDLSVRANNCLESARIQTVRDLVLRSENDLLKVRSFGKTSLREVKRRLQDLGLHLGMSEEELANISRAPVASQTESYSSGDDDAEGDADDAE